MTIRVPLISPVTAIVYRLDISGTYDIDPPGPATTGFDPILRVPVVTDQSGARAIARAEMAAVSIPCQVESLTFEEISEAFGGNDPVTNMAFVFHRRDLDRLSLLDGNGTCLLKPRDRIDHLEKNGSTVLTFQKSLYIYEVRPRSHGMGPTGYDLEVCYTSYDSVDPRRAR